MAEEIDPEEIAEALVCIARIVLLLKKLDWLGDVGILLELEDELSELHQELR